MPDYIHCYRFISTQV